MLDGGGGSGVGYLDSPGCCTLPVMWAPNGLPEYTLASRCCDSSIYIFPAAYNKGPCLCYSVPPDVGSVQVMCVDCVVCECICLRINYTCMHACILYVVI